MTTAWDDLAAENARLRKELEERAAALDAAQAHENEMADMLTMSLDRGIRLEAALAEARRALELPLIFHSGGYWSSELRSRWSEITGTEEATTKIMCDTIRRALGGPS
jgi:hypothetical protein